MGEIDREARDVMAKLESHVEQGALFEPTVKILGPTNCPECDIIVLRTEAGGLQWNSDIGNVPIRHKCGVPIRPKTPQETFYADLIESKKPDWEKDALA